MIAKYKPTRRFVTVASATLTCIILALTFTRAADPAPKAKPAETSASTEVSEQAKRQRTIRVLEREVRKLDDQIASKQKEMDALKMELGISDVEAAIGPGGTIEPETLRKLEGLRIEAKADYTRSDTFYRYLTNLSRAELRKAIATASPDQQLIQLLGQFHTSEQKMAAMLENQGTEHPEVRAGRRLLEQVTKQIEERLDGILKGLEAKTQADKARLVDLQKEVDRYKHYDIEQAIKRRPYYQAKRDLENLQLLRERLQARLFQERIDAAIETEQ